MAFLKYVFHKLFINYYVSSNKPKEYSGGKTGSLLQVLGKSTPGRHLCQVRGCRKDQQASRLARLEAP